MNQPRHVPCFSATLQGKREHWMRHGAPFLKELGLEKTPLKAAQLWEAAEPSAGSWAPRALLILLQQG